MGHPTIQVADAAVSPDATAQHTVRTAMVEPGFFDAFDARVIAGRAFHDGDLEPGRDAVIVNQSFVRQVLGGRDPIGRRVREVRGPGRPPGPTYEIVGVVRDVGVATEGPEWRARLYRPAALGGGDLSVGWGQADVRIAVRVAGRAPTALAPRLRAIALAVDPALRVDEMLPLDEAGRADRMGLRLMAGVIALFAAVALLLSSTGIYAMMAFTVSQRTREIGIRAALGAHPGRIVAAIFARGMWQLAAGAAVGAVGATLIVVTGLSDQLAEDGPWLMLGVAAFVIAVGLVACAVPARRALRIQPTEALRQVG
jgi:hypothetical protein